MIRHNKGPSMEGGQAWRRHCWSKARKSLLKTLPIEILRVRVARAAEIGLDYKSYASIRAASGHDVIAFLFSSNALRVLPKDKVMPEDRVLKLDALQNIDQFAARHAPLRSVPGMKSFAAPNFSHTWGETRAIILHEIRKRKLPRDGVVVIGDTRHEQAWSEAARLAGYVSADRFFGAR